MANLYSIEAAGVDSRPVVKPSAGAYGARLRRYRATITLASQATTDNILLCILPSGSTYTGQNTITSTVSLGTSVVAIGTNQVHASNGQLRAAGTFTAVDTPTPFGLASAISAAALTADTRIYLTIATAALPASGTLVVEIIASNA